MKMVGNGGAGQITSGPSRGRSFAATSLKVLSNMTPRGSLAAPSSSALVSDSSPEVSNLGRVRLGAIVAFAPGGGSRSRPLSRPRRPDLP